MDPNTERDRRASAEPERYTSARAPKRSRRVSLASAIGTTVTAVVLTLLLTFSLTAKYYVKEPVIAAKPETDTVETDTNGEAISGSSVSMADELATIDRLFRSLTVYDLDDQALLTAVLKAYVAETGDNYAEYFTAEEYAAQISDQNGKLCGIGISVTEGTVHAPDGDYQAILVVNVYADSPAEEAGVRPGDFIIRIGEGDGEASLREVGYTNAMNLFRGEEGSEAVFTVLRGEEEIPLRATRRVIEVKSVLYHVYTENPSVGVVRLTGFESPTAGQFKAAMEDLIGQGCTSFVLDLRNNPGGRLTSVEDVATFFLREDDVILHTRTRAQIDKGEETTYTVMVARNMAMNGSGTLMAEDVGRYADYPLAVLTNGNTASAAELLTSVVRDHKLGTIVGTKTFGKGIMQTTYPLSRYGYEGGLKLTTAYYDPPSGVNYHGIGITPDIECELSEEAQNINFNLLTDAQDDQLRRAVEELLP